MAVDHLSTKEGYDRWAEVYVCHDLAHGLPLADAARDRGVCGRVVDHVADLTLLGLRP